jgi:hypothetical protein
MASPPPDGQAVEVVGAIGGAGVVVAQCGKSTRLPGGVRKRCPVGVVHRMVPSGSCWSVQPWDPVQKVSSK